MTTQDKDFPPELRKLVPPWSYLFFIEWKDGNALICASFTAVTIYGPIIGPADHNGFRYLFAPLLCPAVAIIVNLLTPYDPYAVGYAGLDGMTSFEKSDPESKRLVAILRSDEARRFIWGKAARISALLYLFVAIATILTPGPLKWSINSPGLVPSLIGGCLGALLWLTGDYIAWGILTWANQPLRRDPSAISMLIQASPMIVSHLMETPSINFGHNAALLFAWSLPVSFFAGVFNGSRGDQKRKALIRGSFDILLLTTVLFVGFQARLMQFSAFYVAMVWGVIQVPAVLLGCTIGYRFFNSRAPGFCVRN